MYIYLENGVVQIANGSVRTEFDGSVSAAARKLICALVAKPGCWEIGFRQISLNI